MVMINNHILSVDMIIKLLIIIISKQKQITLITFLFFFFRNLMNQYFDVKNALMRRQLQLIMKKNEISIAQNSCHLMSCVINQKVSNIIIQMTYRLFSLVLITPVLSYHRLNRKGFIYSIDLTELLSFLSLIFIPASLSVNTCVFLSIIRVQYTIEHISNH